MKRHFLRTFCTLFTVALCTTNCESEKIDELTPESIETENASLQTVPVEETLSFLSSQLEMAKGSTNKNSIDLNVDLQSIEQVDLTNTDAKLNIVDATTKFKHVETQVLQIEIDGTIQTILFHQVPDNTNANKNASSKTSNSYFTGSIYSTDLSGNVLSGFSVSNGNVLGTYNFFTNSYMPDPEPCWGIACGITLDEVVITTPTVSPYYYSYNYMSNTSNSSLVYQWNRSINNYSTMGTAYADYYWKQAAENYIVYSPTNPIKDIKDYLKCFDVTKDAEITIYVDQPVTNSNAAYTKVGGNYVVGHTFVSIKQGNNISVFGFYPDGNPNPLAPSDPGILGNDQGEAYDVSISTTVSSNVLSQIINYSTNYAKTYNLNSYNCSDFGISIGNLAGMNLPDANGSWPLGGGSNPGALGQHIRNVNNPNFKTNLTANNAPKNKKGC